MQVNVVQLLIDLVGLAALVGLWLRRELFMGQVTLLLHYLFRQPWSITKVRAVIAYGLICAWVIGMAAVVSIAVTR